MAEIKINKIFYFIIILLILQSVWFAITAQYPMAFDENYHFGVIQIFSHQWSPFISNMPADSGLYGDLTRFNSYLYHYLMSFPYRLISTFIHEQVTQIIILRFINIGLFIGGLLLFRRLFRQLRISEKLINFSLFMLILIPVVPFLSATINYDNLMFLLVPVIASLAITCRNEIVKNQKIPAKSLILLITIGLLSCIVKYAFLPIFVAVIIYLLIVLYRSKTKLALLSTLPKSFKTLKLGLKIILIAGIVVSAGLFIERYGINLVKYHRIEPDCAQIQSVSHCLQNLPWKRNHQLIAEVTANNPAHYPSVWLFVPAWIGIMIYHLYFAINYNFTNYPPLPIPFITSTVIGIVGLVLCFIFWRSIIQRDKRLLLFGIIIGLYVSAVFYQNFTDYLYYRNAIALNGRYFIPIFPLLFIWIGLAYNHLFNKILQKRTQSFIAIFVIIIILLLSQGGGALTHLVRSQSDWYWQNQTLIDTNLYLKNAVSPFIIGGKDY